MKLYTHSTGSEHGESKYHNFLKSLIEPADTKIFMLIMDGLGGLPREPGGKTELETASTPNLDALAELSALGLSSPAGPGIAVGSGPGHLAIFGFDPFEYEIGRGALEALGVDFDLEPNDVAARGNFCTVDANGILTDRRAGRIASEESEKLVDLLNTIKIDGAEIFVRPVKEHRFAFVIRGEGLGDYLSDTDPQKVGVTPSPVEALDEKARKTAKLVNEFISKARTLLADRSPANMVMLRGFAKLPSVPLFQDVYGLHAASIAVNGMYRGVSRLVGMEVLPVDGINIADEFATLEKHWQDYDFFYLHIKKTDTYGESGDFDAKARIIEEVDSFIPRVMALNPAVVVVSGDHSSPAVLKSHSWHPVPTLLYSKYVRADGIREFGERACSRGSLGVFSAQDVMPLVLANAGRLAKYNA
jgi:2,3-bisphosphoglycerate-independent phosphoglycerate mutase